MGQLSKEAICDFQQAYLQDFGKCISEGEACVLAGQFLELMSIVYRPILKSPTHE